MIRGLTGLLIFQLLGELVVALTGLPVPGPVVGMLGLFIWLRWRKPGEDSALLRAGSGLLRHLQLLFVPAGVGVTVYVSDLADAWLPITIAMFGSWLVALVVVGWGAVLLERLLGRPRDDLATEGT